MEITVNDLTNSQNIICLSGVPNVLKFSNQDTATGKTNAVYRFYVSGNITYDSTKKYTITFGDYTITGTTDINKVGGTTFLIPTMGESVELRYCVMTIANALKNVPWILANYDVYVESDSNGAISNTVIIRSKKPSVSFNVDYSCNWGSGYTFNETTPGQNYDTMLQGNKGKNFIFVDVYEYDRSMSALRVGATPAQQYWRYVTTLQKTYFGEDMSFNLTPILQSLYDDDEDRYNEMKLYRCVVYGFSNGKLIFNHATNYMWFVNGYQCNESEPFLNPYITNKYSFCANLRRGSGNVGYNNPTRMYTYYPQLDFSVFTYEGATVPRFVIYYVDSAGNDFYTQNVQYDAWNPNTTIQDCMVMLDEAQFKNASYIDVRLYPLTDRWRYNVIKPIKATDEDEVDRVFWYNEYGGVSFMDFTGERTETRKENIEYYEKQSFDFYTNNEREMTKVYSKKIPVEVKHKTHYIDKNGTYLLYSLQNSKKAWIYRQGRKNYIHITNLEISESSNASHIYTGQITYSFSLPDLF